MYHLPIMAAASVLKWYFDDKEKPKKGSAEDLEYLHKITKALSEDIQNLASSVKEQQEITDELEATVGQQREEIILLRRQIGAVFFLSLVSLVGFIWIALRH